MGDTAGREEAMMVCAVDGVDIATNYAGVWVHTDGLPKGVDPDHIVEPIRRDQWDARSEARADLRLAAEEMVAHHAMVHPLSDCEWAQKLMDALEAQKGTRSIVG